MNPRKIITSLILTSTALLGGCASQSWNSKIIHELPFLGHRNWIVVADSAYPLQTSPGIETICATGDQLEVFKQILADLTSTRHVKPIIYTDAELKFIAEKTHLAFPHIATALPRFSETIPYGCCRMNRLSQNSMKPERVSKSSSLKHRSPFLIPPYFFNWTARTGTPAPRKNCGMRWFWRGNYSKVRNMKPNANPA